MDGSLEPPSIDERLREVAQARHLAAALLHGPAAAEVDDVLQEASMAALAAASPASRRESFVDWIRGTVRHLSITVLRRRSRRLTRERAAARAELLPSTADVAHRLELQRALLAAVESLAPPIRDAVVRRYLDEVPPREIAWELGEPLTTVKARLRRGLAQLREKLRREWGEEFVAALLAVSRLGTRVGTAAAGAPTSTGGAGTAAVALPSGQSLAGVVAMSMTSKLAIGVVALAIVGAATIAVVRSSRASRLELASADATAIASGRRDQARDPAAARVEDRASDSIDEAPPAPGSRRARLGARRVGSILGTVVDAGGSAVAGAEVAVVRPGLASTEPFECSKSIEGERHATSSSPDGSFRFDDLVRGVEYGIVARAADGRRGAVRPALAGTTRIVVLELKPTMTLEGVVVDARDGRPVEGAAVRLDGMSSFERPREFDRVSDAEGRFTIGGVGAGLAILTAVAPDGRVSGGRCPTGFVPGGKSEIRIPVGGNAEVAGRVVDADTRAPIAGAALRLAWTSPAVAARSATDGTFRIRPHQERSQAGSLTVGVAAAGYAESEVRLPGSIDPDASLPPVEIQLKREATAVGRLVLRDGSSLASAGVFAFVDDKTASHPSRASFTDADGAFRIVGLDPSVHHFLVIRHDECEELSIPFPDDEITTRDVDFGTIAVGRGAILSGRVVDASGAPLPEAHVKLLAASHFFFPGRACDANGCFEFAGVPAGLVRLIGSPTGQMSEATLTLDVGDEAIVDDLVLKLAAGSSVTGRIVDSGGAPVKSATIYLVRSGSKLGLGGGALGFTTSDEDGRFRIAGVDQDTTGSITLMPSWNPVAVVPLPEFTAVRAGASGLQIVQPDGKPVTGRIVDEHDDPIEGALVRLLDSAGAQVTLARSHRDGGFSIPVPVHVELRCEVHVADPGRSGVPLDATPVAASSDQVHGGDPPLTIVIRKR